MAAPERSQPVLAAMRPECMTMALPESEAGGFRAESAEEFLQRAARADALAVGPGLGTDADAQLFTRRVVAGATAPLVLDADAIKAFAGRPELLAECPMPLVITPHPGEMAHLLGTSVESVQADRFAAVRRAAELTKAVVLLKGAYTLDRGARRPGVHQPDRQPDPGDGGFRRRADRDHRRADGPGHGPPEAAAAGAFLHGLAGDRLARRLGLDGVLAGEIAAEVPAAQQAVREGLPDLIEEFVG